MSTTIHPQPLTPTWALLLPYEQVLAWLEHLRVLFDDISGWTVDSQAVFGELVRAVLLEAAGRLGATPVVMAPRAVPTPAAKPTLAAEGNPNRFVGFVVGVTLGFPRRANTP